MIPRVARRFASTDAGSRIPARKNKQTQLYGPKPTSPTSEESVRILKRRIVKAEREERMDITMMLTPVKTYMGGFTRPKDLRISNWSKGGRYTEQGKSYVSPSEAAYEPHVVFLLESRHPIHFGHGRVDSPEHVVGVCRECDFEAVLRMYNSEHAPSEELGFMDSARWPWMREKHVRRVRWWDKTHEPADIIRELYGTDNIDMSHLENVQFIEDEGEDLPKAPVQKARAPTQVRAFSTSARVLGADSYNPENVVPKFYVDRKRERVERASDSQREAILSRKSEESNLMESLSDGILSDRIAASTRRLDAKIPTELYNEDGELVHPSGFVVPSPGDAPELMSERRRRDLAQQTAAVAERVLEEDFTDVSAETRARTRKVPWEVRQDDGTVAHPSGFVPPTPIDGFKVSMSADPPSLVSRRDLDWGNVELEPPAKEEIKPSGKLPDGKRGLHSSALRLAQPVSHFVFQRPPHLPEEAESVTVSSTDNQKLPTDLHDIRATYLPMLKETPFWRPLIALTFSTRPLAASVVRLARGLPRGLPFYASIESHDRKSALSYSSRMTCMRIDRMRQLAVEVAQMLAGARGGPIGIRFGVNDRGRGVDGTGLESPIPAKHRVTDVAVGDWYWRHAEVEELFIDDGMDQVFFEDKMPFKMHTMDEFGKRRDLEMGHAVPWPVSKTEPIPKHLVLSNIEAGEGENENKVRREKNMRKRILATEHKEDLALWMARRGTGIVRPSIGSRTTDP